MRRGFCQFVLGPIYKLIRGCVGGPDKREALHRHLEQLGIDITDASEEGEGLIKRVMANFLPLPDALMDAIATHLPSSVVAQKYRMEALYAGPIDDECALAISLCDKDGPLMLYVANLAPSTHEENRFYAFGRVFSGTLVAGQQVRILGPDDRPGQKGVIKVKDIERLLVAGHGRLEETDAVSAGNLVYLAGHFLVDSSTITSSPTAHPFKPIRKPLPVVHQSIQPNNPADLPKVIEALRKMSRTHLDGGAAMDERTGELVVSGMSERHLEMLLGPLARDLAAVGVGFARSSVPAISLRETVVARSSQTCMAKSPNKHTRLWMTAEPLPAGLADAIESGSFNTSADRAALSSQLHTWEVLDARRIWCWGPDGRGPNAMSEEFKYPLQYVGEIRGLVEQTFQWGTREGALCEEPLRGVRFKLVDFVLTTDAIHRGAGQLIPAGRRVLRAAQLDSRPRLMEPVYLVETHARQSDIDVVTTIIAERRGQVMLSSACDGGGMCRVKAYLPVVESFGFASALRQATGRPAGECVFDHWQMVEGDPLQAHSTAAELMLAVRRRKGLKEEIPSLDTYLDRL